MAILIKIGILVCNFHAHALFEFWFIVRAAYQLRLMCDTRE